MEAKFNWDLVGIGTSLLCAVHCALLPLLMTSLPLFGVNIIHNMAFEWTMIAIAFVVGNYALVHGYIKHHRSPVPIMIFAAGFILLLFKQFFHEIENWLLIPAVILIVSAHFYNYRLCHRSKCSSPHHKH
ncbi:MAG: MerC domain-containing protein [Ferruginibacter sp.]